jgi:sugar phosphate isomerase/epimerase
MRFGHRDGQLIHLGYCTNVHPAEDLPGILDQLDTYALAVRAHLHDEPVGLGLWLAAPVAAALAVDRGACRKLRRELAVRGLEVVTLNGFPYQSFHAPVVKRAVYQPDWSSPKRLKYTLHLAAVLAELLPDDAARGSVSTLPLGWRKPWGTAKSDAASRMLDLLATGLAEVADRTSRPVRVGFEPEPGCVVETTAQAVDSLSGVDTEWIGICLDLAHLACAWEDPAQALGRLAAAGLPVVKVQVSAALEVADPVAAAPALARYAEPRFLHQTRDASGHAWDDLDQALADERPGPWRVHYHMPVHDRPIAPLTTTVPVLRGALDVLLGGDTAHCDHLDVETYTWDVLPDRPPTPDELAAGIAAELAFTRDELHARGLASATGPGLRVTS